MGSSRTSSSGSSSRRRQSFNFVRSPHAVQHGLDFDVEVVTVPCGDAFFKAFDACGKDVHLRRRGVFHAALSLSEPRDQRFILCKDFFHCAIDGGPALKSSRLGEVAHADAALARDAPAVRRKFAEDDL